MNARVAPVTLIGTALVGVGILLGALLAGALYEWEGMQRSSLRLVAPAALLPGPAQPARGSSTAGGPAAAATILPAATVAPAVAAPTLAAAAAVAGRTGDPAAGKVAYDSLCNACHPGGRAGLGPDLRALPAEQMTRAVRQGRGGMPGFKVDVLSDKQMEDMLAYLSTLQ